MGTLRKMGAFLGLVPDEANRYDDEPDYQDYDGYDDHDAEDDGYGVDREYGAARSDSRHSGRRPGRFEGDADAHGIAGARYTGSHPVGAPRPDDHAGDGFARYAGQQVSEYAGAPAATIQQGRGRPSRIGGSGPRQAPESSEYQTDGALAFQPQQRAVRPDGAADGAASGQKPATVKLAGFADAREVGETYRVGQAVILDMTDLSDVEARRMVDFAAGLAFAVRGSIDKVTTKVFMLHPPEAESSDATVAAYAGR